MYRPEGWPNREFGIGKDNIAYRDAFEAGADAMLEGLKKVGTKVDIAERIQFFKGGQQFYLAHTPEVGRDCVLIIVPEEKDAI